MAKYSYEHPEFNRKFDESQPITFFVHNERYVFYLKDHTGKIILFEEHLSKSKEQNLDDFSTVFKQNHHYSLLKKLNLIVLHNPSKWLIVPDEYFINDLKCEYLSYAFNYQFESQLIYSDFITDLDLHLIYKVEQYVLDFYNKLNQAYSIENIVGYLLKLNHKLVIQISDDYLSNIKLLDGVFYYTVFKQNQLIFINQYKYQAPEDIIYYIFKINQTLKIKPHNIKLYITGFSNHFNEINNLLQTYFVHLKSSDEILAPFFKSGNEPNLLPYSQFPFTLI